MARAAQHVRAGIERSERFGRENFCPKTRKALREGLEIDRLVFDALVALRAGTA
jgi:hypothetical protein